ncbi:hypothetical protein M0R04_12830 [Candidatus Dojkabacteria bacterium]|jgi:hypothetical protein|nr:hypothetical protein [Candidatus Dojkabacteria bacterium]
MEIEQSSHPFTENGFKDIDLGVTFFRAMQLGTIDLKDPVTVSKVQEIADFLEDQEDPGFVLQSLMASNKSHELRNIDHIYTFVLLNKEKNALMNKLDSLNKQLKYYE